MQNAERYHFAITALVAAAICGTAFAQDAPERAAAPAALELTMVLIPANAQTPDAVTKTIELPKEDSTGAYIPSARAVEHSEPGLDTANAAREDGRAFGAATAAAARDNRENAVRAGRENAAEERTPPPVPETPGPPGPPGPPPR